MELKLLLSSRANWLLVIFLAGLSLNQTSQADTLPMFGVRAAVAEASFSGMDSSNGNGFGVVLGVTSAAYRVYADLNFYSFDKASTRTIHANYDYLWQAGENWQIFTGIYGGLVDLELDAANKYQSGPSAGVQAGFLLPLGASGWRLETGVRYGGFDAKLVNPATQLDVKIKSQAEGFITLNFAS